MAQVPGKCDALQAIVEHQARLRGCRRCPRMTGPVVVGSAAVSPVMLVGQAPGAREGPAGRPFAWTAGKTLFRWFSELGASEPEFRERVYMTAVCRCYPGKQPKGGDRVPDAGEIANCRSWWERELAILGPRLVIPVGKLAIAQLMPAARLADVVGRRHRLMVNDARTDVIPLPHPSGASTWTRMAPGKDLLRAALGLIGEHPAWKRLFGIGC